MRKKLLFYVLPMMLLAFSATVAAAQEYYYASANETTESTWKETCGLYVERLIRADNYWTNCFHKGHSFLHFKVGYAEVGWKTFSYGSDSKNSNTIFLGGSYDIGSKPLTKKLGNAFLNANASAGIAYTCANKKGNFGCYVNPRVNMRLFRICDGYLALTGSYMIDFYKFKFKEEYMNKHVSVGLAYFFNPKK